MKYQLQNLKIDDHAPEVKDGAHMILPAELNALLEIFPSNKSVLLVDLRLSTDFEKSHVHGAINLRAPLSFIQNMTLESIQDTFVDDQSRRSFSRWIQSRCVVFYNRVVEYNWDCPVADALYERFRRKGWLGECFILKGHYREFSASFDKYISGSKMTGEAKEYLDSLRENPTPNQVRFHCSEGTPLESPNQLTRVQKEINQRHARYEQWLQAFENQDRTVGMELSEAQRIERLKIVEEHQKELEIEFEMRFPALHKKSRNLKPGAPTSRAPGGTSNRQWEYNKPGMLTTFGEPKWQGKETQVDGDDFDAKAQLVGPLASGLDKMREAASEGGLGSGWGGTGHTYRGGDTYVDKLGEIARASDEFDEIDVKGEGLKNDPAFQRAGKSFQDVPADAGGAVHSNPSGGDELKKAKKKPLWNRLRSTGR
jgi:hypothetical protein